MRRIWHKAAGLLSRLCHGSMWASCLWLITVKTLNVLLSQNGLAKTHMRSILNGDTRSTSRDTINPKTLNANPEALNPKP